MVEAIAKGLQAVDARRRARPTGNVHHDAHAAATTSSKRSMIWSRSPDPPGIGSQRRASTSSRSTWPMTSTCRSSRCMSSTWAAPKRSASSDAVRRRLVGAASKDERVGDHVGVEADRRRPAAHNVPRETRRSAPAAVATTAATRSARRQCTPGTRTAARSGRWRSMRRRSRGAAVRHADVALPARPTRTHARRCAGPARARRPPPPSGSAAPPRRRCATGAPGPRRRPRSPAAAADPSAEDGAAGVRLLHRLALGRHLEAGISARCSSMSRWKRRATKRLPLA